ncbi:uncharacterized protein LOC128672995 [Plodia interpunctella]|uniref:uncharacterized protein LOC128672995 n=1 Tax=Plodia interpunctella TaxID=58824 RepID=UPI002367E107|nr:uncharacterized protein LOC128672995 [Plodia interpunctella]
MDSGKSKKIVRRQNRKTIAGIKLPPLESSTDGQVKTILDIDPDFYSLVEGRPIKPNASIYQYKQNIKEVALKKTLYGFLVDEILRIDKEIEVERNVYESATKHFDEYQNSFDKFLADDNNKTISIMKKSDGLAKELLNQSEEHKKASYEYASLKSKIQYIDETLGILLSFQNFLCTAAPILWREKQNVKLDIKHEDIFTMDSDILREINIESIKDKISRLPPPILYFETPDQLVAAFDALEKQNLNYLLATEELNSQKNKFLKSLDNMKLKLQQELDFIQQKIKESEEMIVLNELRETEVKDMFFRILGQKMKYLISSDTALQVFNYVEFVYEHLISPNDIKLSSLDMALALESEYDNLMLDISLYNLELVKSIEKEVYEDGDKQIKRAKEAHKLLRDVDKLNRRLKSSYEPSRKKTHNE